MGLARKLDSLRSLQPDIAVLSEVACPEKLRSKLPELRHSPIVWVGDNPNKGLAILSFNGNELALDSSYRIANRFIAPVHVIGPRAFRLLAVWDHHDRKEGLKNRAGPLLRALEDSATFCQTDDLVVAGDFNNNPLWDRPNKPNNMLSVAKALMDRGLVSVYHHKFGVSFGAEIQGTYWHYRRHPYHIDYIFAPRAWLKNLVSFRVGSFAEWAHLSDHAPLIAEFR
jgi:endonuclease/exonuclease/phosphatase family metal-dependent hydrolase